MCMNKIVIKQNENGFHKNVRVPYHYQYAVNALHLHFCLVGLQNPAIESPQQLSVIPQIHIHISI